MTRLTQGFRWLYIFLLYTVLNATNSEWIAILPHYVKTNLYLCHWIRLCSVVMFHVQCFEPQTCITEGFGALEMHLSWCLLVMKPIPHESEDITFWFFYNNLHSLCGPDSLQPERGGKIQNNTAYNLPGPGQRWEDTKQHIIQLTWARSERGGKIQNNTSYNLPGPGQRWEDTKSVKQLTRAR